MKTKLVPLIGDPRENLYQLGIKEAESFRALEERVTRLLSTNNFLRYGQDIISRTRALFTKRKELTFFNQCIEAYAEGLGIDSTRYMSFLSLFELAAHYGQVYPELKGLLPGCTSLFEKTPEGICHSRLLDFPLTGLFDLRPRLYFWQFEGRPSILNYSCEGLAPLFFQAVHSSGVSLALHHKPGGNYHQDGQSIFQITFDTLFESTSFADIKKELKKKNSVTKWGILLVEKEGQVQLLDIDGPNTNTESFNLNETPTLIFTNIPLQKELVGFESYLQFCTNRQSWLKDKLKERKSDHILDLMTDVKDQKIRKWIHSTSTLSTVGAIHVNLSKGFVDVKDGDGALVASDEIIRFSLAEASQGTILKAKDRPHAFELAWKKASQAQSLFDQGHFDLAYHELQMSITLMPHPIWKEILSFYLCSWDFRFLTQPRELAMVYQELKALEVPHALKDQWLLLCMRIEKKLNLALTVNPQDLSPHLRPLFIKEREASKTLFTTWMKLLYPRIEILDIFSPHHK
jgi:hypothetical protein